MSEETAGKVIPFPADKVRGLFEQNRTDSAEITRLKQENEQLRSSTLSTRQEEMDEPARKAVGTIADAAADRVKQAIGGDLEEMRSLGETIKGDRNKARFDTVTERISKADYAPAIADTIEGHYRNVLEAHPKMDRTDALVQAEKDALYESHNNGTYEEAMKNADGDRQRAGSTRTTANGRAAADVDIANMTGQQLVDSNKVDEAYLAFAGRKSHF